MRDWRHCRSRVFAVDVSSVDSKVDDSMSGVDASSYVSWLMADQEFGLAHLADVGEIRAETFP